MITRTEVLGSCPLGQLIKETKIDRFGYFAGSRIYKQVRQDWLMFNIFESGDKGLTYSDYRFYAPHPELKEVAE